MAKKIIILERLDQFTYRYAMWATVPATHWPMYANNSLTSAYTGATAQEIAAIQGGQVTEKVDTITYNPEETQAQNLARLIEAFTQFQKSVTNENTWSKYGTSWDGASWTVAGTA